MLDLGQRIIRKAAMDRTGLHHGRSGSTKKAEANAGRASGDVANRLIAPTDRIDEAQVCVKRRLINPAKALQPCLIEVVSCGQHARLLAVEHHTDVEEFLALNARYTAQHHVLIRQPRH